MITIPARVLTTGLCKITFPLVLILLFLPYLVCAVNADKRIRATTTKSTAVFHRNGKIAFTSDRDGNPEIYVMNADGSDQVRLTDNPGVDDFPAWSPDGRRLAYLSHGVIKLMNADGTGQAELTAANLFSSPARTLFGIAWFPSGDKIAFQENGDIYSINTDGTGRINLTNSPSLEAEPAISPDGLRIAFSSDRDGDLALGGLSTHVFVMNSDGSNIIRAPVYGENYWCDFAPDWSPAGNQITLATDDFIDGGFIRLVNDDGTYTFITNAPFGDPDSPRWSPDGTKIVFTYWVTEGKEIYVNSVQANDTTQLTSGPHWNYHPSWQPLSSSVSIGGRVTTPDGRGLRNATVWMTDSHGLQRTVTTSSFGYYTFEDVATGQTYTMGVLSRLYRFTSRPVSIDAALHDVDFVGLE